MALSPGFFDFPKETLRKPVGYHSSQNTSVSSVFSVHKIIPGQKTEEEKHNRVFSDNKGNLRLNTVFEAPM